MSKLIRTTFVTKFSGLAILLETFVKGTFYLNRNANRIIVTDTASTSASNS
jgi:hypothetical protein